jgi:hypothetical protein
VLDQDADARRDAQTLVQAPAVHLRRRRIERGTSVR